MNIWVDRKMLSQKALIGARVAGVFHYRLSRDNLIKVMYG